MAATTETVLDFDSLMRRVRDGCPEAVAEAVARFSPHIRRVVRCRLSPRLRERFDSQDFMQSVWANFFRTPDRAAAFATPDDLTKFLARMARCKVVNAARRDFKTDKRDRGREVQGGDDRDVPLVGHEPTPSQVVIAAERWERMLAGQPEHYRRALILLRQGYTHHEIALRIGVNPKALKRFLRRLLNHVGQP
jgi:RNA polymerase sigma factor (sigma-70 family)